MRLPNNMERYTKVFRCVSLLTCYLFRTMPAGVTINSQISDTPMSRIKFSDNDVVTMNIKIDSLPVSCAAT